MLPRGFDWSSVGCMQGPRVKRTGNEAEMKQFIDYLQTQKIQNDCSLACVWDGAPPRSNQVHNADSGIDL